MSEWMDELNDEWIIPSSIAWKEIFPDWQNHAHVQLLHDSSLSWTTQHHLPAVTVKPKTGRCIYIYIYVYQMMTWSLGQKSKAPPWFDGWMDRLIFRWTGLVWTNHLPTQWLVLFIYFVSCLERVNSTQCGLRAEYSDINCLWIVERVSYSFVSKFVQFLVIIPLRISKRAHWQQGNGRCQTTTSTTTLKSRQAFFALERAEQGINSSTGTSSLACPPLPTKPCLPDSWP